MAIYIGNLKQKPKINEIITNEVLSRHKIYGVTFTGQEAFDSYGGIPLFNAIDLSPNDSAWDETAPFITYDCYTTPTDSKRKVLSYDDPEIQQAKMDTTYNLDEFEERTRMVEFPLAYYFRPDPYTFLVSPDSIEGFLPSPGHVIGNKICDCVRISKEPLGYYQSEEVYKLGGGGPIYTETYCVTRPYHLHELLDASHLVGISYEMWSWIVMLHIIKRRSMWEPSLYWDPDLERYHMTEPEDSDVMGVDKFRISQIFLDNAITLNTLELYSNTFNLRSDVLDTILKTAYDSNNLTPVENLIKDPTVLLEDGWKKIGDLFELESGRKIIMSLGYHKEYPYAIFPGKLVNAYESAEEQRIENNNKYSIFGPQAGWVGKSSSFDSYPSIFLSVSSVFVCGNGNQGLLGWVSDRPRLNVGGEDLFTGSIGGRIVTYGMEYPDLMEE